MGDEEELVTCHAPMEAQTRGCLFTCRSSAHLTIHQKAVHGLYPETSKTAKKQTKNSQELVNQNIAPGDGAATSGAKSAPSTKASVEVNAPLPKLIIKFKIPRNTKA